MLLDDVDKDRAGAYRMLADLFSRPPAGEELEGLKEDLELESKDTQDEIRDDFSSLFALPDGKLPPVESFFTGIPNDDAAGSASAYYADAGLVIDDEYTAVPDHLSLEFLFMSYLIDSKKTDFQINFVEAHIINWVPDYCDEVVRQAGTSFYREIAEITQNFISNEYENLE